MLGSTNVVVFLCSFKILTNSDSTFVSVICDQIVILSEYDMIISFVFFVEINPLSFDLVSLSFLWLFLFRDPAAMWQGNQELFMFFQSIQHILVLFNLTFKVLDLRVNFLDLIFFLFSFTYHMFSLFFLILGMKVIWFNKLHKFDVIVLELVAGIFQSNSFSFWFVI